MAKIVTITNPLTGQPVQVDQLDHTAQQIDDGLNIARGVSNPNLLDNWYFANPVNQKGQTSYTGAGYGIDRWTLDLWNHVSPSLLISDGYITLSNNTAEGTASSCYIRQHIDNPERFAGQTVTFSVLLGAVAKGSGKLVIAISVNGSAGSATEIEAENANSILSKTLTLPSEVTSLSVYIGQYASNAGKGTFSIQLKAAKLELGTTQTLAHQENGVWVLNEIPDYGEQLARCQRNLYRDGGSNFTSVGYGLAETAKTAYFLVKLPVPMRVRPSVTYAGNWTVWDGVTGRAIESMAVNEGATNPKDCSFVNIKVDITGSDLTIGKMYQLCVRSDKSAYIEFLTEL